MVMRSRSEAETARKAQDREPEVGEGDLEGERGAGEADRGGHRVRDREERDRHPEAAAAERGDRPPPLPGLEGLRAGGAVAGADQRAAGGDRQPDQGEAELNGVQGAVHTLSLAPLILTGQYSVALITVPSMGAAASLPID